MRKVYGSSIMVIIPVIMVLIMVIIMVIIMIIIVIIMVIIMLNNFCFHVNAQKCQVVGLSGCQVVYRRKWQWVFYTLSCEFRVHRAGSQVIIGIVQVSVFV